MPAPESTAPPAADTALPAAETALPAAETALPLRARLLREAAGILATAGMPGLTVRRVAEAAGCSTIGVYTHFGGKPGLVEALMLDCYLDFEAAVAVVDRLPSGREQLQAGAHAYRDWALANRNRYLIMFTAYADFSPGDETVERLGRSLVDHTRRVAGAVAVGDVALPSAGAAEPDEPARDVDRLAYQVWACVHGYVLLDLFYGRDVLDQGARRDFDAAVRRILDGMAPR